VLKECLELGSVARYATPRKPLPGTPSEGFTPPDHLQAMGPTPHSNPATGVADLSDRLRPTPLVGCSIALSGRKGFRAMIDTGATFSLCAPYIPRQLKIKVHLYKEPKTLALGAKGSQTTISAYCYIPIELAGFKRIQRFDIGNIFVDIIIGRDFLRTHKCEIAVEPDTLVARDLDGSEPVTVAAPISKKKPKAKPDTFASIGSSPDPASKKGRKVPTSTPVFRSSLAPVNDKVGASDAHIKEFHDWILASYGDIFIKDGDALPMPPIREVEHTIPFIDKSDPPGPRRTYKVLEKHMSKWNELHDKHVQAGLWIPKSTRNTDPMMPVVKKDSKLRPVVDLRARNANTVKLTMPPVDTDYIRTQVALHRYILELDVKGAFQQLRVKSDNVWKTAFSTIYGTYVTPVAQQGDTNSTVTLAATMSLIYQGLVGRTMLYYADNIWSYTDTWDEFITHSCEILQRSREHSFFMNANSLRVCPPFVEVLGMHVTRGEIAMDPAKRDGIITMLRPTNKKSLQQFVGCVEWLSRFLPSLASMLAPLQPMCGNAHWDWTASCELAFEEIKEELKKDRKLTVIREQDLAPSNSTPVHLAAPPPRFERVKNPVVGQYIFLQCDASQVSTAASILVRTNWWLAKPVTNHSRKLTNPQFNYRVHETELLAVFEGLQKFESQLLGCKVIIVTDNSSLSRFLSTKSMTPHQARAYKFMCQFDLEIRYIEGEHNHLADTLSRQYEGHENIESSTDPSLRDLDDEPLFRDELFAISDEIPAARPTRSSRLPARFADPVVTPEVPIIVPLSRTARRAAATREKILRLRDPEVWQFPHESISPDLDPLYMNDFIKSMLDGYVADVFFSKVYETVDDFVSFAVDDIGLLWQDDDTYGVRLCIPAGLVCERSLHEIVLEHLHEVSGHVSSPKLVAYAHTQVWWPSLSKDAALLCLSCPSCQAVKKSTTRPVGKLRSLPVPEGPLEGIALDFQGPFVEVDWHGMKVDFILNFIDLFTGELISIPCKQPISAQGCAELFFSFVFPRWGVPKSVLSDRDVRFKNEFWRALFEGVGTTLLMSTAYHPATNGRVERMHRDLNQIMRQMVDESQKNWADQLPFAVFAINSMKSSSSGCSPFELARTSIPNSLPDWAGARRGTPADTFIESAKSRLSKARDNLLAARTKQAIQANKRRGPVSVPENAVGSLYWLKSDNLSLTKDHSRKWAPPFVGPFRCIEFGAALTLFTLDLPARYTKCRISPRFTHPRSNRTLETTSLCFQTV
jgi:transposase InsO family protein